MLVPFDERIVPSGSARRARKGPQWIARQHSAGSNFACRHRCCHRSTRPRLIPLRVQAYRRPGSGSGPLFGTAATNTPAAQQHSPRTTPT